MKNNMLYVLAATSILLAACSSSVDEESREEPKQSVQLDEQKSQSKDVEEKPFLFQSNGLEFELDKSLADTVRVEGTTFWFTDDTLPEGDIMLGRITSMSLEEWQQGQFNGGDTLVYYDANQMVYVFDSFYDWSYAEGEFVEQYEKYLYDFELIVHNLLTYGFQPTELETDQLLLTELDVPQPFGIEASKAIYQDIQQRYTEFETLLTKQTTLEEKNQVIAAVKQEFQEEYPELRQIPFPTIILGENIAAFIDLIKEWPQVPYTAEQASHIHIENEMEILRQYLEVINKQITEVEMAS